MATECKHGRLERQCNECRLEEEVAELRTEVARLRAIVEKLEIEVEQRVDPGLLDAASRREDDLRAEVKRLRTRCENERQGSCRGFKAAEAAKEKTP